MPPAANSCPPTTDLQALLDGALSDIHTHELTIHLEICERCQEELDRLAAGEDWPEEVARHLSRPGGPESAEARRLTERWKTPPQETRPNRDGLERLEFLEPSEEPGVLGMLGPYEITETIGRGGFGLVLKGRDPRLNRVVAVKVLSPEWASNATARKRFLREAQAAAAVRHDHVVTIYAVDELGKLPYLVMEYVPGKSLQERVDEQGPLEVREVLRIGRQIAQGLSAAHAEGLIHRDIKPGNILLEDGIQRVKITDFGLARAVDDVGMTQTGTVAGTPEYMSPEQAWAGPVDHRTDLFSLGGVLYAMCTGRSPFRAKSAMAVLKRVCEDVPRPIEDINPEISYPLIATIERLLAKAPEERYASAQQVADVLGAQLTALQNADTVHMPMESAPEPYSTSEPPRDTWSWVVDCFHQANRWGRGLWGEQPQRRPPQAPEHRPRIRWSMMFAIAVMAAMLMPFALYVALESLEGRNRTRQVDMGVAETVVQIEKAPQRTWSPPLASTNELTLDIRDPELQISIDGRPYPVEAAGKHLVRLGDGLHKISIGDDDRGWFEEVQFSTPTSESYLRIDRSGILQSTAPAHVQVQWIPSQQAIHSLRFQGRGDRLLGQDFSTGQILTWDIPSGEAGQFPIEADRERFSDHRHPPLPNRLGPPPLNGRRPGVSGGARAGGEKRARNEREVARRWTLSNDGNLLAIGGNEDNGEVRLFDIADPDPSDWSRQMTVAKHNEGPDEVMFSPDGQLLLCASKDRTEIFRLDDLIVTKLGEIPRLPAGRGALTGDVVNAKFLPDNRRVLISDKNGHLEIWNTRPLRLESAFQANRFGWSEFQSIDFDRTGRRVLLNGRNKIALFDLEQGKVLSTPNWPGEKSLTLRAAYFLPDNEHAVLAVEGQAGSGQPQLWIGNLTTGTVSERLDFVESLRTRTNSEVRFADLRFSSDHRRITSACAVKNEGVFPEYAIALVDWTVPEEALDSGPNGESEAGGLERVRRISTPAPVASLAFTPEGKQFVTGDAHGGPAILWSFPEGEILHRLPADEERPGNSQDGNGPAAHVAISPDGESIAECRGTTLRLWDRQTGQQRWEVSLREPVKRNGRTFNRIQAMRSVVWSPDGRQLLIACPKAMFGRVGDRVESLNRAYAFLLQIDEDQAKIVQRFEHPDDVHAARFLGEGSRIATACEDGRVRIWELGTGELQRELRAGPNAVRSLDATADGTYVAGGMADGRVSLWETRYGREVRHFDGKAAVTVLAFLPQETRLITGHADGRHIVWHLEDETEVARTEGKTSLTALAVSPHSPHLLTASAPTNSLSNPGLQLWKWPAAD